MSDWMMLGVALVVIATAGLLYVRMRAARKTGEQE